MTNTAFLESANQSGNRLVSFLRDIVAIPSLSCKEGQVVERMKQEMEGLGYDEVRVDPMGNLIGRIGNGPFNVAFDGHCDVVDEGRRELWDLDPFDPVIKDGFLFGRGASDQKGGLAAAIYGAALLAGKGIPDHLSIYVVASVQEEDCDGLCWQYIIREGVLKPDVVMLTEPTNMRIYRGHRGRMEMEIGSAGVSCHGSAPERGDNAIYKMAPIIRDIEQLNENLPPRDPLGKGTITISRIRSRSPSLCAVADGCWINLDRRLTIKETEATSVAELEALPGVQAAGGKVTVLEYAEPSYRGLVYPTHKYYPTWILDESAPLLSAAKRAHVSAFDCEGEVGCWTFSTNGVATAGMFDIPTLGFGPGEERFAHAPNEKISTDDLVKASAFYAAFAEKCGGLA